MIAKEARTGKQFRLEYTNKKITGNGSFGVVYQTRLIETNEEAAIKKVLQDRRFKVGDFIYKKNEMEMIYSFIES